MQKIFFHLVLCAVLGGPWSASAAGNAKHVVVVVWDGMRPDFISQQHTPTLWKMSKEGVMFENHHSAYCTSTEVNGTAIATGCYPEHSGIIANRDYLPDVEPLKSVDTQSFEVIRKGDRVTGGHYLLRPTLAEIFRAAGKTTVIAGSKEVVLLHDRKERDENAGVTLFQGKTIPRSALAPITNALGQLPREADTRSTLPNEPRDEWTARALLNCLWSNGVPDFSLLWLSEPDYSQHAAGPGSPKALAAVESSDRKLAAVFAELERRGLRDQTDVFVVSDHGFSTVEKSVDVCQALTNAGFRAFREFKSKPKRGDIMVAGQAGSILFYVTEHDSKTTAKLVEFLQQQDFSGVLFTRKKFTGTFRLSDANVASPREPDIVLAMRWSPDKSDTGAPGLQISDGSRKRGQGNHASLSPYDVHNTLVGIGPDLKTNFANTLPTANYDLTPTILWLFDVKTKSPLDGRIMSEALSVDAPNPGKFTTKKLEAQRKFGNAVWQQYLKVSRVGNTVYLDEGNGTVTK